MKKVLIVDERFPYTGGTRTEKMVKYLPNFGWKPVILTIHQTNRNPFADDILKNYENHPLKIYTTKTFPTFSFLNHFNLARLGTILNRLFYIPDTNLAWIPNALIKAFEIFKRENPHVIYSTSPNEGVHLVGYLLKLKFKKPWIADFRDLWTLCYGRYGPLTSFHHAINFWLEKSIYRKWSDLIIANTEENKRIIIDHFHVDPNKIEVITNGFDPDEILQSEPQVKSKNLILGYFGAFIKPMTCHKEFLYGMEKALESEKRIDLKLWTLLTESQKKELMRNPVLRNHVSFQGYFSHQQSIRELAKTDILLVILKSTFPYVAPQKLYNYMALKKPILAIAPPDGCAARVIRETKTGTIVSPDNPDEIADKLLSLFKIWEEGGLKYNPDMAALNKYRSDNLTKDLSLAFSRFHQP